MDKEFIMATAKTIEQQILWSISKWEYMSWGIRKKVAIEYESMATLALRVSGAVHKGWVFISLNEGKDCYEVRLLNVARTKVKRTLEEVYCDNLGQVLDSLIERKTEWTDEQYKNKGARDSAKKMGVDVIGVSKDKSKTEKTMTKNKVKFRPATMAEIEGRDTNLYMDGEQVWVMMIQRSETIGEGEAKLDYIMLTNMKKVQVEDLQVIDDAPEESPMMKQWRELKEKHPDALLLFRCGDFYETYEDDAAEAAKVLGITLTKSTTTSVRMAGFPHHALDTYLPKLIRAGKRVAICDQLEDPKLTKKLVKRGITELVSPATNNDNNNNQTSEDNTMATKKNNNESKNVQNNAQVNNETIDVNVGEVTVDSIQPAMQPVEGSEYSVESDGKTAKFESIAPNIGTEPEKADEKKADVRGKMEEGREKMYDVGSRMSDLRHQPSDIEHQTSNIKHQTSSLPMVQLVVYTTKRGEQAPRIEGFGGENDPRWKRHYDDKVRLAQQKKEADVFNEKLQAQMKGKPKAEREKLRKQWKSVGSDPFGASYFTDRTTGDKCYQMTMGAKYLDVARDLVDAYNSGDEQAIAAAEQAIIDCKNGIVQDIEAEKAAKRAEREAKKAAAHATKPQVAATAGYSDQDVADMLRKVMAGGDVPENIKKLLLAA